MKMKVLDNSLFTVACVMIALCIIFSSVATVSAFTPSTIKGSKSNKLSVVSAQLLEVNSEELFGASTFPITPEDLIARAKEVIFNDSIRLGTKDGGKCLSENFVFRAQFVEVNKEGFLAALENFNLESSFEIQQNYFGFTVDPMQTNRVWYFTRAVSKHTGTFAGVQATGKVLKLPTESHHLDFDENGLITELGFYTVDRAQGNTGGLGGAFGYFYGVGAPLPFPEGRPYKPSMRYRLLQKIGNLMQRFQKKE